MAKPTSPAVAPTPRRKARERTSTPSVSYATNANPEAASPPLDPTTLTYGALQAFYTHFNSSLFQATLPPCLLTLQRKRRAYGYFAGGRFVLRDGTQVTDEIALNPAAFALCSPTEIASTLVHEMVHLQQHHFGKSGRGNYHNREFARMMQAVGLITSRTGEPGGERIGEPMSHYIAEDGPFVRACAEALAQGLDIAFVDRAWQAFDPNGDRRGYDARVRDKRASKTAFHCDNCGAQAWGKPALRIGCLACDRPMEAYDPSPAPFDTESTGDRWSLGFGGGL